MTRGTILDAQAFQLVVSVTIATLALTPYLMSIGPWLAARWGRARGVRQAEASIAPAEGHVVVVGYGPTGEAVGHRLHDAGFPVHVVDLNPRLAARAESQGLVSHVGDATYPDVLEHAFVARALAVAVTLPDPAASRQAIEQVLAQAPCARVFARARYHLHRHTLAQAGAETVVDEEEQVGRALAEVVARALHPSSSKGERP